MNAHPLHPAHNPITIGGPEITIVRARSAQRNWSDPVSRTQHEELAQAHAFTPAMFHDDLVPHHAVAPIAAAVCRDVPMRRLQSTPMAHYRNGSTNYSRFNNNIISSIHDFDLYEDGHHAYDAYGVLSGPRAMRQAPKLLTLDDYNLISLGYKPVGHVEAIALDQSDGNCRYSNQRV
ncbi:hypothetical protein BGX31_009053 [Mortierella sp. GBA43]|nr:hypothetical protein BGX31_009053 [Mortierella sp. GBA43]